MSERLSEEQLAAIKARCEAATREMRVALLDVENSGSNR